MPKHPLKKQQRYFVTIDDVLISTQYMLFNSLLRFSKKMNDNKLILDGDDMNKTLDIPETENEVFEKILIDYKQGNSDELVDILEMCQDKLNEYVEVLGIEDPEELPQGVLVREERRVIKVEELFNIHSSFPIKLSSITSRFAEGLVTLTGQFTDTHTIVYDNTIAKKTFEGEMFKSDDGIDEFGLPVVSVDEMYKRIQKELSNKKDVRIITSNPDIVRTVFEEEEKYKGAALIKPKACQYMDLPEEIMNHLSIANIW